MSAETKWTPGPWRVEENTTLVWCCDQEGDYNKWPVAQAEMARRWNKCGRPTEDEAVANAHLIAAAPCLYAALDSVMREIVGDDFEGNTDTERNVVKDAWAALRKARGEQ